MTKGEDVYYYLDHDTVARGIHKIDGKFYYFAPDGKMLNGEYTVQAYEGGGYIEYSATITFGEDGYAIDEEGNALTTLDGVTDKNYPKFARVDGSVYYYTQPGAKLYGLCIIENKYYYFDTTTGEMLVGEHTVMAYDSNGLLESSATITFGNEGYAVDEQGNALESLEGLIDKTYPKFVTVDGKTYYYTDSESRAYGLKVIDGRYYFFDTSSGEMRTGAVIVESYESGGLFDSQRAFVFDKEYGYAIRSDGTPIEA